MGHVRLGVLPTSRKWRQVVHELRLGADVDTVAAAAADAAEAALHGASRDPAFLHAFWLLTQIPLAARGPAFADDLRSLGLEIPDRPSLMDVAAAYSGAVDRHVRKTGRPDRSRRDGPDGGGREPHRRGRPAPALAVRPDAGRGADARSDVARAATASPRWRASSSPA